MIPVDLDAVRSLARATKPSEARVAMNMMADEIEALRVAYGDLLSRAKEDAALHERNTIKLADEIEALRKLRKIVGLAHQFVTGLDGAKLRKSDFANFAPLVLAMNELPIAEVARCLDAAKEM